MTHDGEVYYAQMHVQREQVLVLPPLLILAAAAWVLLIWLAGMMNGMGLTMGTML